jgi:flagellar motility protein MotE (MotC chaperone)
MENTENSKKSSLLPILLGLGITVILLGGFVGLIKFNVGGLGNQVMRPLIEDIPVLNLMLPRVNNRSVSNQQDNTYGFETIEEATERLRATERLLANKENDIESLNETIERLTKELDRLRIFEEQYVEFQEDKALFDETVVFNENAPDIREYRAFYESIFPQNAENIYQRVVEETVYNDEVKRYANTFQEMKVANAARILEEMATDLNLVVLILNNIETEQRAKILGAMQPQTAARITRIMAP